MERLEAALHPWVSFVIMPLFAFANAGVPIEAGAFTDSVAIAVVVGLCVGKPVGIVLISWLAVRTGLAKLPEGVSWGILAAGGVLAGIGFTMSLFIAGLALSEPLLLAAKIGILTGSALCAVLGSALLLWLLPRREQTGSAAA
jgi:NhaA family Na+:H+ antiporter